MFTEKTRRSAWMAATFVLAFIASVRGQDSFLPRIIPSTLDVSAGERLSVTGQGFVPNERIFCYIPTSNDTNALFILYADQHGRFTEDLTYPAELSMPIDVQRYVLKSEDSRKDFEFDVLYSAFVSPPASAMGNGWFSRIESVDVEQLQNISISRVTLTATAWPSSPYQVNAYQVLYTPDVRGPWTFVGGVRNGASPETGASMVSRFDVPYSRVLFFRIGDPTGDKDQLWFSLPQGKLDIRAGGEIDAEYISRGIQGEALKFSLEEITGKREYVLASAHAVGASGKGSLKLRVPYTAVRGSYRLKAETEAGLFAYGNGTIFIGSPILSPSKGEVLQPGRSYETSWPAATIPEAGYNVYLVSQTVLGSREFSLGSTTTGRGRMQFTVPISIAEGVYRLSFRSSNTAVVTESDPFLVSRHD